MAASSYACRGLALNLAGKNSFYSSVSLQIAACLEHGFRVLSPTFQKGQAMKDYIKLIPAGAVLALMVASASAQTAPPAATASTPATVGVTPQEAAEALKKAVPRSNTATLVRTAPSPAAQASEAMTGSTTAAPTAATAATATTPDTTPSTATAAGSTATGAAPMTGSPAGTPPTTMRRARADRN
jgi:hypothetical protein